MKRIFALLVCGFIFSSVFAEDYEQLYMKVIQDYGYERLEDFNKIWTFAFDNGAPELEYEQLKYLLDNPQCLTS